MNTLRISTTLAALAALSPLTAQECLRPEVQLNSGLVTTSAGGFNTWRTCSPKQDLPGDPAADLAPTSRVAYAVWIDQTATGDLAVFFLRSNDGGWSWNTALARPIYTIPTGTSIDTGDFDLVCDGHTVFVGFSTDRGVDGLPTANNEDLAWVVGSNDQGRTFQEIAVSRGIDIPLANGDDLNDVDETRIAASNGRCHVVFEADFDSIGGSGTGSGSESVYYQAVGFDASGTIELVLAEELQLNAFAPGAFDIDTPFLAASGDNVLVGWHDPRVNGGDIDDTVTRVSNDNGNTFGAEFNHTNFTADQSEDDPECAALGDTLVVLMGDTRDPNLSGDQSYVSISTDAGATWTTDVRVSAGNNDVDDASVAISESAIVVVYPDDRSGANEFFAVVDQNGGADFINGTATETRIFGAGATFYGIDAYRDVFAFVAETTGFPEDAALVYSRDACTTFERCSLSSLQFADVDDLDVAVSVNQDINAIWQDDGGLGNDRNNVYTSGLKIGYLLDETASRNGLTYVTTPAEAGNMSFLVYSASAPVSNATPLAGQGDGIVLNFVPDILTTGTFVNPAPFVSTIGPDGTVRYPLRDYGALTGITLNITALSIDANGQITRSFADPIRQ